MSDPPKAHIRPFEEKDLDAVRYFVGSDIMEAIPLANKKIFSTSAGVTTWLGLAVVLMVVTGIYPSLPSEQHSSSSAFDLVWQIAGGVVSLVPFLGSAIVLLAIAEIQHRSIFERALERRLKMEDMRDITAYYGAAPASGFYVLDYDGKVIGCIGVDASRPQDPLDGSESSALDTSARAANLRKRKGRKSVTDNTENIALIRCLAVSAAYRPAGVEEDLLRHALTKCFAGSSPVQRVQMALRPKISTEKIKLAESFGMQMVEEATPVDADLIEIPKDAKVIIFVPSKPLSRFWPIDLRARLWSIDKTGWKH